MESQLMRLEGHLRPQVELSPSPAKATTKPVPKYHTCMSPKSIQERDSTTALGTLLRAGHPFCGEILPSVHSKPPLAQPGTLLLFLVTFWGGCPPQ